MPRPRPRLAALLSGAALLAAVVAVPGTVVANGGSTLYVGPGGGPGACAAPAYATIAAAVAATSPGDTVHICAGTYNLAASVVVPRDLSFVGDGAATTIVDGANGGSPVRLFDAPMVNLSFAGLALRNGRGEFGGAIFAASVIVTSSTFTGNSATVGGGAIYADASLSATDSTFSANSAASSGGAVYAYAGSATFTRSAFSGNTASRNGGAIFGDSATVTVTSSTFSGNSALASGGAIRATTVTATNSTFSGNSADGLRDGGAINAATVLVTNCTFSGNSAGAGGALAAQATITVAQATITVTNSTFSGNTATYGGAITSWSTGTATVTNSTFGGNTGHASGGAIFAASATIAATVTNSTFSGNSATASGGAIDALASGALANTIVSGVGSQCAGPVSNGGGNVVTDASCPGTVTTIAALGLMPLANNGGPTQTMALGSTSAALEAGVDATCAAAPVSGKDQRGIARPQGAHCDSGAFERIPTPAPSLAITRVSPLAGKVGATVTLTGTGFSAASGVTFNGKSAAFSVRSPSMIVATVPAGATTGYIRVTTRTGLSATSSPFSFHVLP